MLFRSRLAAHAWPGNVRELENVVQRALIMSPGEVVEANCLPLTGGVSPPPLPVAAAPSMPSALPASVPTLAETPVAQASPANMKDLERQHILDTLARVGGSRKKAVAILGISERTLRYKLSQYRAEGYIADDGDG